MLDDAGGADRPLDGLLQGGFGQMVAADGPGARFRRPTARREEVLPAELSVGLRVFLGQGVGQVHPTEAVAQVGDVDGEDVVNLAAERLDQRGREDGRPVPLPLAVADDDARLVEVDILDPQPEALHQPQARAVEQAGGQPGGAVELGQYGSRLLAAEDGRQPLGGPGSHDLMVQPVQRTAEDDLVEEEQRAERLILGGSRHVAMDRQVRQERDHLRLAHLQGMPLVVEQDEILRPLHVGILGADAVMQSPGRVTDLIEQPGHVRVCPWGIPSISARVVARALKTGHDFRTAAIIGRMGVIQYACTAAEYLLAVCRLDGCKAPPSVVGGRRDAARCRRLAVHRPCRGGHGRHAEWRWLTVRRPVSPARAIRCRGPRAADRLTRHCSGPRCARPLNLGVSRLRSPGRRPVSWTPSPTDCLPRRPVPDPRCRRSAARLVVEVIPGRRFRVRLPGKRRITVGSLLVLARGLRRRLQPAATAAPPDEGQAILLAKRYLQDQNLFDYPMGYWARRTGTPSCGPGVSASSRRGRTVAGL